MQVSMATKESQTYVRRRKGKRAERNEEIGRSAAEGHSFKRDEKRDSIVEDDSAKRLINLELDVAEALADFWRMAHEPSQQSKVDVHLRWSRKRRRSSLLNKDSISRCKPKEEPEDALSFAKKNRSSCTFGIDSSHSDRDEIESMRMSKESSQFESRAQSPSSPLPSMQLPFLPCGSPAAKSAFQRVLPLVSLQRPYLLPVKSEIEDTQPEGLDVRPQDASVRRKSKSSKSTVSKAALKKEDWKGAASLEEFRVKAEVYPVSDLIVMNKSKSALSEKEKEVRRLRRIQANRESARQTIRKKQVVCEELIRKASSLAFENEGMKKTRESLMQELYALKGQNYHLKQQLEMGASGNFGLVSAELPLKTSSEPVSAPDFQVRSLPYTGIPAHSFTWAMAAAQAAAANQAYTFNAKEKTLDASHDNLVLQHQATAVALPAIPSSKEVSAVRATEQKSSHDCNGACSPASMGRSQKETGCPTIACMESCTPQSGVAPCDPSTTGLTDDLPKELACEISGQANRLLSQPPSFLTYGSKAGLDTMPAMKVAYESMECFMGPHIPGVRSGYTYNGSNSAYFFHGHSQTITFMGRNYVAAMAAAEARRRRKELIRHKFSRS